MVRHSSRIGGILVAHVTDAPEWLIFYEPEREHLYMLRASQEVPDITVGATQGWLLRELGEATTREVEIQREPPEAAYPQGLWEVTVFAAPIDGDARRDYEVCASDSDLGTALACALLDIWGQP